MEIFQMSKWSCCTKCSKQKPYFGSLNALEILWFGSEVSNLHEKLTALRDHNSFQKLARRRTENGRQGKCKSRRRVTYEWTGQGWSEEDGGVRIGRDNENVVFGLLTIVGRSLNKITTASDLLIHKSCIRISNGIMWFLKEKIMDFLANSSQTQRITYGLCQRRSTDQPGTCWTVFSLVTAPDSRGGRT